MPFDEIPVLLCFAANISLERALRKLRRSTESRLNGPVDLADSVPSVLFVPPLEAAATASRGELVALLDDDSRLLLLAVELRRLTGDILLAIVASVRPAANGFVLVPPVNAMANDVGLRKRLTDADDLNSVCFSAANFCCCCCCNALAVFAALLARTLALYACSDSCEADDLFDRTELCMEPPRESTDRSTSEPAASATLVRAAAVARALTAAPPPL